MEGFIYLAITIAWIVGMWKMFEKAGEPAWAALIPFYNLWVLNRIGGKEWWWFIGYFIPLVNIVMFLLLSLGVARNFGENTLFGIGVFFAPFIFYPVLGFGRARYIG